MERFILTYLNQVKILAPFWLAGAVIGSLLSLKAPSLWLKSSLNRFGSAWSGSFLGSMAGAISPLGLFGALPILGSCKRAGVKTHILVAFLVASPIINPVLFIMSFVLGWHIALARVLSALALGSLAGILYYFFSSSLTREESTQRSPLQIKEGYFSHKKDPTGRQGDKGLLKNPFPKQNYPQFYQVSEKGFFGHLAGNLKFTAKYLAIGMAIASTVDLWFPRKFLLDVFGADNPLAVLIAVSLGVPIYTCGGGSLPLIREFLFLGMSPGAALGFMISGPATKATNLAALYAGIGRGWLFLYIVYIITGALGIGYLSSFIL